MDPMSKVDEHKEEESSALESEEEEEDKESQSEKDWKNKKNKTSKIDSPSNFIFTLLDNSKNKRICKSSK